MLSRSLFAWLLAVPMWATARASEEGPPALTEEQAVAAALSRSRDIIAAKLNVQTAEVDQMATTIWANPEFSYSFNNFVLGAGNPQGIGLHPGPFTQGVQTFSLSETLDIWLKRSLRWKAAERGVQRSRLDLEDAIREVSHTVRTAFEDALREQEEYALARQTRDRYQDTLRLFRSRLAAGDISDAELRKMELEGIKYTNNEIDAQMQLDVARQKLASLLVLSSAAQLPQLKDTALAQVTPDLEKLQSEALRRRPDVRALAMEEQRARGTLRAEGREAFPDPNLGVAYTNDHFTVSGDNPNTLALTLSFPLPVFNQNQAGIAKARIDLRATQNSQERLAIEVREEVAEAARRAERSRALLAVFEGGMLEKADTALRVAEKSYRAGAVSLLEFLEAQRTNIETHAQYLQVVNDHRQAVVDLVHAVGGIAP